MKQFLNRVVSRLLIVSLVGIGLPLQSAQAAMVSTDQVGATQQTQQDRERVKNFFNRDDVRAQMQARGVDADVAKARIDAMTDEEVQKVVGKLDTLPAGGDVLGVFLGILLILLITDLLGWTKVYPFTRSVR